MRYEVVTTEAFDDWLDGLADHVAQKAIAKRLIRMASGNFGDSEAVGKGISELRIHVGPGYRVYYVTRGRVVVVILLGGTKRMQSRDIEKAKEMAADLE